MTSSMNLSQVIKIDGYILEYKYLLFSLYLYYHLNKSPLVHGKWTTRAPAYTAWEANEVTPGIGTRKASRQA